jgi:hypothetical protein
LMLVSIGAVIALVGLLFLGPFPALSMTVTDLRESLVIVMPVTGFALVVSGSMYIFRMRTPSERIAKGMTLAGVAAGIVWLIYGSSTVLSCVSYSMAATIFWKLGASMCSAYLILALAIYHRS